MLNSQLTAVQKGPSSCQVLLVHRMCDLLMANQAGTELGPRSFDGVPHNLYINRDSVESLHHLLNVQVGHSAANLQQNLLGKFLCSPQKLLRHACLPLQETQGLDFQSFLDLLQRVGEEQGLLDLDDEILDDWLPMPVIRDLLGNMNSGAMKVMADIVPVSEVDRIQ